MPVKKGRYTVEDVDAKHASVSKPSTAGTKLRKKTADDCWEELIQQQAESSKNQRHQGDRLIYVIDCIVDMLSKRKCKTGEPSSSNESDESEEAEEQVAAPSRHGGKRGIPAKDHAGRSNHKHGRT